MKLNYAIAVVAVCSLTAATAGAKAVPDDSALDARMKLASQIVEANGGAQRAETMIRNLFGAVDQGMARNLPPAQAKLSESLHRGLQTEFVTIIPDLLRISERTYAENLSEGELKALLAWAQSETGRSINKKMPDVQRQILSQEMPVILAMMPNVLKKAVEKACDEAQCTPQERQIAAEAIKKTLVPKS